MNKSAHYALLLFTAFAAQMISQEIIYKSYSWEDTPKIHALNAEEKEANFIKLKQKIILDFAYEPSGELVMYETIHEIIHFNNERGVEERNKVYIPYGKIIEEMELKARAISPDGNIIPLNKNQVKKVDNLENSGPYLIFAMEGAVKDGEIEYVYTNKKTPNLQSYWILQDEQLKENVEVDIYSPDNLLFEAKGYNGFPAFKTDTAMVKKNHIYCSVKKMDGLIEEKYSAYNSNRMRFDYLLTHNSARGKTRLYSWEAAGVDFYNSLFVFTKAETKAVEKLISKLGLSGSKTEEEKIAALEIWVKTNINLKREGDNKGIDKMLDLKYGDYTNFQRIFILAAQLMKIPVEAVLTCDRMKRKFDPDFPSYNNLEEYLLYFPSIKKFMAATDYRSRLGFASPELTGTNGLFIKETSVGDLKTGVARVKFIDADGELLSQNNIEANIQFHPETFVPQINFIQKFTGYAAYYLQADIPYLDDNGRKQFLDGMAKFIGKETVVKSSEMSGTESADVMVKPLVFTSKVETPLLVENAGRKLLFKVGEIIGPQQELYQDKKRQTNGEIMYNHSYERNLEIKIPAGYKITNPGDLKMDVRYSENDKVVSRFISEFTLNNNVLKIKVFEDYDVLFYPKERYEEWKSVINASADFNKVVLIFEKI